MVVGALSNMGIITASLSLGHTSQLPKVCSRYCPLSEIEHDPCQGKCEGSFFQGPFQMEATDILFRVC